MMKLNSALFDANEGGTKSIEMFAKLGLSASQLAAMPMDQQLIKLSAALANVTDGNQRAAIAVDLFGNRGTTMLNMLNDSDALAKMVQEASDLGLTLSRIDASKVEYMNDALTTAGKATTGLWQEITIGLAPAIGHIATSFTEAVKGTLKFGSVSETVNKATMFYIGKVSENLQWLSEKITQIKLAFNSLNQARLVFQVIASGVINTASVVASFIGRITGISYVLEGVGFIARKVIGGIVGVFNVWGQAIESVIRTVRQAINLFGQLAQKAAVKIPFADNESKQALSAAQAKEQRLKQELKDKQNAQRASVVIDQKFRTAELEAEKKQQAAKQQIRMPDVFSGGIAPKAPKAPKVPRVAAAASAAPRAVQEVQYDSTGALDELDRHFATEQQKIVKANNDRIAEIERARYKEADIKRLGFETEIELKKHYIQKSNELLAQEQEKIKQTAAAEKQAKAEENNTAINAVKARNASIYGEMLQAKGKLAELENIKHAKLMADVNAEIEILRQKGLLTAEIEAQNHATKEQLEATHQEKLAKLLADEEAKRVQGIQNKLNTTASFFSALSGLTKKGSKEQQRTFKIFKAFSLASAMVSMYTGMTNAMATPGLPLPLALAAAAGVAATGAANIASIRNQQISGIAHGGLGNVPKEATYLLDKGERVVSPRQNLDLMAAIDKINNGSSTGTPSITINNLGTPQEYTVSSITANEVVLIARDVVRREAGAVVANEMANPNSGVSRAITSNTNTTRRRA
jgi:hypothetical protein